MIFSEMIALEELYLLSIDDPKFLASQKVINFSKYKLR
jgi:hypothetical protein